ncbi:uncharacterized protein [Haliaeetus albicilla]|uniref:uncharacterized protein n=1 Tax=Haliaeetus albicilla TaxID=8969 RepID=UPI0037E7EED2
MWRTAKRLELQKSKGGEKEKEASELARSPGSSKSESCASPSASHKENPAWSIPLAAQLDVSWHRFALVALSSAVTVRDRWKDSVVACKYKLYSPNKQDAKRQQQERKGCSCCGGSPRVFSLSPFRLSPRPTGGGGASERSRGALLLAGVKPRHELMLRRGSLWGCCCPATKIRYYSSEAAKARWCPCNGTRGPTVTAVRHRGKVPPRSLLPPGKETPLLPHVRGVGGRSARKARNSSAGTAQVRSSAAASAGAALWAKCGTAARRSRAGSDPSGAPSTASACAVPGSSVVARRARVSAAAGERRDRG